MWLSPVRDVNMARVLERYFGPTLERWQIFVTILTYRLSLVRSSLVPMRYG